MANTEKVIIDYSINDNGASDKAGKLSKTLTDLAKKALVAVSVAIGKSIIDFARFEKTLTNVYTLLDQDTFNKFGKDLEKGALKTMEKFGLGIEDTNKALFDTISAGVSAGDAIGVLDTAGKLAVGGVTNISTAVDGLTSVMNAYGKENFNATKAANTFFTAQKYGKTTVEALANNIGQLAPIANSAGLSFEETAAAMSTLTLAGLSTEEATTSVKAILQTVIAPASESAQAFKDMGIATTDANGKLRPFGDILADIEKKTGGNVQKIAELFPNVRALGGAAAFSSGKLGEYNTILKATQTDTTSLNDAFKKQQATLDQQRKVLGSVIQTLGIQLASKFAPALIKVNEALTKLLQSEKVRALFDSLGNTLGFVINVLTGVAKGIGFIVSGLWTLIKPFAPVLGFLLKVTAGFIAFAAAIAILANPITLIVGALGLLGKAIDAIFNKIKGKTDASAADIESKINSLQEKANKIGGKDGGELSKKEQKQKDSTLEEIAALEAQKRDMLAAEEDAKTALMLEKDAERNQALLDQQAVQREEKVALEEELAAIKDEEELAAFEEKLVKMQEQGQIITDLEAAAEQKRADLKRANWAKDFAAWMGMEKIKLIQKQTTAQQMANWDSFMANSSTSKTKEVAAVGKAMAKKDIAIKTAQAAMGAFTAMSAIPIVGPVLGFIAAAAAIAFGAEQLQAVDTPLAEGGSMIVDQPTRIGNNVLAGEAGPERIDVTPLSGGGGEQTINNNIILDGEVIATNVLKVGQRMRSEGTVDDGL